jgi:hypothetical protein
MAIKICARIERELGCKAEPSWLFTSDIVADFIDKLQAERTPAAGPHD